MDKQNNCIAGTVVENAKDISRLRNRVASLESFKSLAIVFGVITVVYLHNNNKIIADLKRQIANLTPKS